MGGIKPWRPPPFRQAPHPAIPHRMSQNPPNLRPDLAPKARFTEPKRVGQPTIGMVSLGCPKALVDSERILTRLRAEGYAISPDYAGADAVIVNTCGFLDSAKAESLDAIGEALAANGRVIVTGCLGAEYRRCDVDKLVWRKPTFGYIPEIGRAHV